MPPSIEATGERQPSTRTCAARPDACRPGRSTRICLLPDGSWRTLPNSRLAITPPPKIPSHRGSGDRLDPACLDEDLQVIDGDLNVSADLVERDAPFRDQPTVQPSRSKRASFHGRTSPR